jgi:hypothetical protein
LIQFTVFKKKSVKKPIETNFIEDVRVPFVDSEENYNIANLLGYRKYPSNIQLLETVATIKTQFSV